MPVSSAKIEWGSASYKILVIDSDLIPVLPLLPVGQNSGVLHQSTGSERQTQGWLFRPALFNFKDLLQVFIQQIHQPWFKMQAFLLMEYAAEFLQHSRLVYKAGRWLRHQIHRTALQCVLQGNLFTSKTKRVT